MKASSLPIVLGIALVGCAADPTVYPSLSPRAVERVGFDEPVVTPAVAAPDPALDQSLATQASELAAIAAAFDRDAAVARRRAAGPRARQVGSEAWLDAQAALAMLDERRSSASAVVTALDTLASARAAALEPPYPALDRLRTDAAAEVAREDAAITALQAALPGG